MKIQIETRIDIGFEPHCPACKAPIKNDHVLYPYGVQHLRVNLICSCCKRELGVLIWTETDEGS